MHTCHTCVSRCTALVAEGKASQDWIQSVLSYILTDTAEAIRSYMLHILVLIRMYKVPLREVRRGGVAQERNPSVQHLTACGQVVINRNMYPVIVKTTFLSAVREAECGEAPSRVRFALSPLWWRTVKNWLSHQYVSSTSTRMTKTFCTGDSHDYYAVKIENLRGEQ